MKSGSLRLRLLLTAAIAISLALLIAGTSLYFTFRKYAEDLATRELENNFLQLASGIRIGEDGLIKSRANLSDPRFEKPYGGLYWQINEPGQEALHSRSLFDFELPDATTAGDGVKMIDGPNDEKLFSLQKTLILPLGGGKERKLSVILAVYRAEIDEATEAFRRDMLLALILPGAALLVGSLLQILFGLAPLGSLRRSVENITRGKTTRVEGEYPSEVMPLVSGLNDLLEYRETELDKARQRASNMAHGIKTPLMVLSTLADKVEASGKRGIADEIRDNTANISDLVNRQLARARMASGHGNQQTVLHPVVARVSKALMKTATQSDFKFENNVSADAKIGIEGTDLLELLGNLLDNARKWAKSKARISYTNGVLLVEDDGPGVPNEQFAEIEKRGVRLDESVKGSGLGLAIVRDLADAYGMQLKFGRSSLGGLSVALGNPLALQN